MNKPELKKILDFFSNIENDIIEYDDVNGEFESLIKEMNPKINKVGQTKELYFPGNTKWQDYEQKSLIFYNNNNCKWIIKIHLIKELLSS